VKSSTDSDDFDSRPDNEEAVVPAYVPPKKKVEEPKEKQTEKVEPPVEKSACKELVQKDVIAQSPESAKEMLVSEKVSEESKPEVTSEGAVTKTGGDNSGTDSVSNSDTESTAVKKEKAEKRSLTETEFWTIILTPEFDETAFCALKKWSLSLLSLFRVQFKDCFVEGFRGEYLHMGYGAALNGFLKGFPYIGDWDFRMDWTYDHEPRTAGQVVASVNICRVMGLFLATVFYGGVIAFKFWRRRAHVLKTNELPELGWIRTKIVKMMAEE